MADTYNKKEREKKKRKKQQEKEERRRQKKLDGKKPEDFVYIDEFGNFSDTPPDLSKRTEIDLDSIQISTPKKTDEEVEEIRTGVVKFFNDEKKFGFISEVGTEENYFVHEDNLYEPIQGGNKVNFEVGSGPKGLIALNVMLEKTKKKIDKQAKADAKAKAEAEAKEEAELEAQIKKEEEEGVKKEEEGATSEAKKEEE